MRRRAGGSVLQFAKESTNMQEPRYYGPKYDVAVLRLRDGTPSTGFTKTLEGELQTRLDAFHLVLAGPGPTAPPLSGIQLEQVNPRRIKAEIFRTADSMSK